MRWQGGGRAGRAQRRAAQLLRNGPAGFAPRVRQGTEANAFWIQFSNPNVTQLKKTAEKPGWDGSLSGSAERIPFTWRRFGSASLQLLNHRKRNFTPAAGECAQAPAWTGFVWTEGNRVRHFHGTARDGQNFSPGTLRVQKGEQGSPFWPVQRAKRSSRLRWEGLCSGNRVAPGGSERVVQAPCPRQILAACCGTM